MKYQFTIEQLDDCIKSLDSDIQWYQQKNKPGVNFSDEYRKERIGELTKQRTEIAYIRQLLANGRFTAIEENLIQFNLIEANLMVLASMVKRITPSRAKMKQECLDLIQDMLKKYFQTDTD